MKSGINVHVGFFPLAFLYALCTPIIEINGQQHKGTWGANSFDIAPGQYNVRIYAPYLFFRQCGDNNIDVSVKEGQQTKIKFVMPNLAFMKGKIQITA